VNTFATIESVISFPLVKYYSVRFDGESMNEFEKFIAQHKPNRKIVEEFNDLLTWIQIRLGTRHGSLIHYFRPEKAAVALPPAAHHLTTLYKANLRLYCYRFSDHVVILFNGGIKTKGTRFAQDCPVVKSHFKYANKLCIAISAALASKDIMLNADLTELIIKPGFRIKI
jgi:hypothetical protein